MKAYSPFQVSLKYPIFLGALVWTVFVFLSSDKLLANQAYLLSFNNAIPKDYPTFTKPTDKSPIHVLAELVSIENGESEQETEPSEEQAFFIPSVQTHTHLPFITSGALNAYFLAFGSFCNTPLYLLFNCLKSDLA